MGPLIGNTAVTIHQNQSSYKLCGQPPWINAPVFEPWKPYTWMTDDQRLMSNIYGIIMICLIFYVFLSIIYYMVKKVLSCFKSCFNQGIQFDGQAFDFPFSNVASRDTYIPEVRSDYFPFPL